MREKWFNRLMRLLITILGAGLGVALALTVIQLVRMAWPDAELPLGGVVLANVGSAVVFGCVFFLLSRRIMERIRKLVTASIQRMEAMPVGQLLSSLIGLILGLVIAALLSVILGFMGESIFTVTSCAILFLVLGAIGYGIGRRRYQEMLALARGLRSMRLKHPRPRRHTARSMAEMLIDASALCDGRAVELARLGFLPWQLNVPPFVVDELRRLADSSDPQKQAKGHRGMDKLEELRGIVPGLLMTGADEADSTDTDVLLLRLARRRGAVVLTCDHNLTRAAAVSDVRALNVNELAEVLRLPLQTGDSLTVSLTREGKGSHQGVGYLPDGTMVVVEGGRELIGQTVIVTVSSALQTGAGRMVFAALPARN